MSISELLQNLKIDASSMTMGEKLLAGLYTTLLAMGVVFIILVLISFIIKIINDKPKVGNKKLNKDINEMKAQENKQPQTQEQYDNELISVITAAIIASESKNIIVRRIERTNNKQSDWEKMTNI
ncbi:hypothetical protein CHF27_012190 [Romboutsia maritimum]|uniref:Uncharacterized protein n=1 Tax=Romboutsia maritimum TaxID=2020948 RepID=A0A371IQA4_9FIRM|nr:OadG family protein [Romboutsia maritimum]RDY22664.1 hypothetical protein CHF27_012190 [Romboutsia maritimum]